ncbi:hypothetical protein COX03_00750 [Candidatus Woesebacteria bacterium CG22_combo_CG10-13_8_21_14_all_39_10]|uniref:DUF6922 domain-containing protein n=4 Tax=Candidatus Woeseibacteriota TaxID=1752722 RepID=A0A2M7X9Z2_9BACT|nr:MAG: hypothetical protein COX03_00750 [Candidatus Woesebacteria bacterium CG22_combo_CG10-13_8_21_14_all_39_10]PIU71982.1 MAG: hypothetical protein COS80_00285 [Candidatus Woesebacteria bacterium CG06_land_8_20_14_3_00_39_27]PIZ49300.1 MAG: hypothetical protein COY29_02075 [Candidatus Woesebacteria bacterium CG_4_10_14_0_2_um_filter_39_14]PJA42968.1 MAG: hypothetical protein CO176_00765 [Candidatus Woesebacteria bacterium CG_4_9_14_3_um_filter_39_10]
MSKIPKNLQGILWSRNINSLDLQKDKNYIVHQILAYGGWDHLTWLLDNYKLDKIKDVFTQHPAKDYDERSFNFIQKILLKIPNADIDKRYYVKTYPRIIK